MRVNVLDLIKYMIKTITLIFQVLNAFLLLSSYNLLLLLLLIYFQGRDCILGITRRSVEHGTCALTALG